MRKSPPLDFELPEEPAWARLCAAIAFLSGLPVWAWAFTWGLRLQVFEEPPLPAPMFAASIDPALWCWATAFFASSVAALVVFRRVAARSHQQGGWWLHFDGQQWQWAPRHDRSQPESGHLRCSFDGLGWMLLSAQATASRSWVARRTTWILINLNRLKSASPSAVAVSSLRAQVLRPQEVRA